MAPYSKWWGGGLFLFLFFFFYHGETINLNTSWMTDKFQDIATFIPGELKWPIFGLHGVLLTLLAPSVLVVWYDQTSQVHFVHSLNPNRSITQKVPIVSDSVTHWHKLGCWYRSFQPPAVTPSSNTDCLHLRWYPPTPTLNHKSQRQAWWWAKYLCSFACFPQRPTYNCCKAV